jgi:hypothetical protein
LGGHDDVEPEADSQEVEPIASPRSEKPDIKEPAIESKPREDTIPDAWAAPGAIMCIAGRGALDDAAADMLAQLLGKHGMGTRTVPHADVSRSTIFKLDVTGVRMVCVCYLEIGGTPAHLRYLLKRLRKQVPNAPIMVGLWPSDDKVLQDEALRKTLGADYYVASLRDGVICCLKVATGEGKAAEEAKPTLSAEPAAQGPAAAKRLPLPA